MTVYRAQSTGRQLEPAISPFMPFTLLHTIHAEPMMYCMINHSGALIMIYPHQNYLDAEDLAYLAALGDMVRIDLVSINDNAPGFIDITDYWLYAEGDHRRIISKMDMIDFLKSRM